MVKANGGVESEELPHTLTPQAVAPSVEPLVTRGEVPYQPLQTLTRGEFGTGPPLLFKVRIVRPYVGAPLRAYVLQTFHRLTQLHIQPLLLPPPPRPLLPLLTKTTILILILINYLVIIN